jgi:hypothetical protein
MIENILTGLLLLVSVAALLVTCRSREATHRTFIERRAELLRCYQEQLNVLHLSQQKLADLLPISTPVVAHHLVG